MQRAAALLLLHGCLLPTTRVLPSRLLFLVSTRFVADMALPKHILDSTTEKDQLSWCLAECAQHDCIVMGTESLHNLKAFLLVLAHLLSKIL